MFNRNIVSVEHPSSDNKDESADKVSQKNEHLDSSGFISLKSDVVISCDKWLDCDIDFEKHLSDVLSVITSFLGRFYEISSDFTDKTIRGTAECGKSPQIDGMYNRDDILYFLNHAHIRIMKACIKLTDAEEVKELNYNYRSKNTSTNALSFPAYESLFNNKDIIRMVSYKNGMHIGDVAISYEDTLSESIELQKPFVDHYTHILIHGILHILGYDHSTNHQAQNMQYIEKMILDQMGIANPYHLEPPL